MTKTAIPAILAMATAMTLKPVSAWAEGGTSAPPKARLRAETGGIIQKPVDDGRKAVVFLDATADGRKMAAVEKCAARVEQISMLATLAKHGTPESLDGEYGLLAVLTDGGELALFPDRRLALVPASDSDEADVTSLWKAIIAVATLMGERANDLSGATILRTAAADAGIIEAEKKTYAEALEEGWAPPPKNRLQRALWDKFHSATNAAAANAAK